MERKDIAHFNMGARPGEVRCKMTGVEVPSDHFGIQYKKLKCHVMIESDKDGQQGEWMELNDFLLSDEELL